MANKYDVIWDKCLELISYNENIDKIIFESFYEQTKLVELKDDKAYITADLLSIAYLQKDVSMIEEILLKVSESNYQVIIYTESEYANILDESLSNHKVNGDDNHNDNLNKEFVFDNFVVGNSNQQSYKASLSVSGKPGLLFNPLFIYGNSGLGKTHLVHSIGNYIKQNKPNMRVLYVTSEEFFNDFIDVTKKVNNKTNDWFNSKYRDIDVLIVDDIQFLKNKEKSNEMFFNVYNDLFSKNKQIVITSDVMPRKLSGLENRLVSRFSQGLSVSIDPPEFNTSVEILKRKLKYFGSDEASFITDEALEYIAQYFSNDVRDLEGALRRLIFFTINKSDDSSDISMIDVHEAFKDYTNITVAGAVTEQQILKTVCSYYNLTKAQITSKSRHKNIATPRHIAIYLTRTILEIPYDKIGKIYGNRDHSTIMTSYHKVNDMINKNEPNYQMVIKELQELLKT